MSYLRIWRLTVLFQWFLMMLSVRPGRSLAISAHLLPSFSRASCRMRSSCVGQWPHYCLATELLELGRQVLGIPPLSMGLS
eukprot:COSAG02_NODE_468_length_21758_cov_41.206796_20_plen_81_part_00